MNSYTGFVMFLLGLMLGGAGVGLSLFILQQDQPRRYLKCETSDRKTKIGLMIDDRQRLFTLEGEVIAMEKIHNFTEYLIIAEWKHNLGMTTINLDRLSGNMEIIEKDTKGLPSSVEKFECNQATQRF